MFRLTPSGVFNLVVAFGIERRGRQPARVAAAEQRRNLLRDDESRRFARSRHDFHDDISRHRSACSTTSQATTTWTAPARAGVVRGRDGNLYGTTQGLGFGDPPSFGTVFKMTPSGQFTTLYRFTGGNDGKTPAIADLLETDDGAFLGATMRRGLAVTGPSSGSRPMASSRWCMASWVGLPTVPSPGCARSRHRRQFLRHHGSGGTFGQGTVFRLSPTGGLSRCSVPLPAARTARVRAGLSRPATAISTARHRHTARSTLGPSSV